MEVPSSLYSFELSKSIPGCKCNDYQLTMVGCACGAEDRERCEHEWVEGVDEDGDLIEPAFDICVQCGARRD